MEMSNPKLLHYANEVYTIEAYLLFKEQFLKFASYCQECVLSCDSNYVYQVSCPNFDEIRQTIFYDKDTISVTYACKMYTVIGTLCSHCLHVLNINYV